MISLPPAKRAQALDELSDEEAALLLYDWPFWARANQLAPPGDWRIWLLLAGRGFGKTRVGAEWVREQTREFEYVNLIGPTAADVRDVMVKGESGIMAVCPSWERPLYRPSTRSLHWPNGAKSLCFSAEDPESLRGPQHQRLWGDEPTAWQYPQETLDMALFGLRLPPDPRALFTGTPKPIAMLRDLIERDGVTITKGRTYDNADNLAPAFLDSLISRYEGTRLGRQELDAELLLDEGLAYRVIQGTHIVPPFPLPNEFLRFEAMDYGTSNPCWLCFAVDYDGNVIAFGLENTPGLPSEQAARIKERRRDWWARDAKGDPVSAICFAPPDIKGHAVKRDLHGNEVTAEHEFNEHGIYFATAQNDRRAGFVRVGEMLKLDAERRFPDWHPRAGEAEAPRFYIVDSEQMAPLVKALRDAPIEDPERPGARFPGEAVDEAWEREHGHAHAACRYGLMSRPAPSKLPDPEPTDPRAARIKQRMERLRDPKHPRNRPDLIDV